MLGYERKRRVWDWTHNNDRLNKQNNGSPSDGAHCEEHFYVV